jgi:hypothetical protein
MTLQLPYGMSKFTIADPDASIADYSPSDTQIYTFKEPDNQDVEIRVSPFDGTQWAILRENNRSWEIEIKGISLSEFENQIEPFRGLPVTFTPHNDEALITYDMIMTFCEHNYNKGLYYRDSVLIKLTNKDKV